MPTIVVQFGLATMPLGRLSSAAALTSGTTRGTSGSIRQAEELSMTTAPAAANRGASSRDAAAPAEKRATSTPVGSAVAASSTTTSTPPVPSRRPTDRSDANRRMSSKGKFRSSRMARITVPT